MLSLKEQSHGAQREGNGRWVTPRSWAVFSSPPTRKNRSEWGGFFSQNNYFCSVSPHFPPFFPCLWGLSHVPSSGKSPPGFISSHAKVSSIPVCAHETLQEPQVGRLVHSEGCLTLCQLIPEGFSQPAPGHFRTDFPSLIHWCLNTEFVSGSAHACEHPLPQCGMLSSSWAHSHPWEHFGAAMKAMRTLPDYLPSWLCFLCVCSSHPDTLSRFGAISSSPPIQAGTATAFLACKFRIFPLNYTLSTEALVSTFFFFFSFFSLFFLWSPLMQCKQFGLDLFIHRIIWAERSLKLISFHSLPQTSSTGWFQPVFLPSFASLCPSPPQWFHNPTAEMISSWRVGEGPLSCGQSGTELNVKAFWVLGGAGGKENSAERFARGKIKALKK